MRESTRTPSLLDALIPLSLLIGLLGLSVYIFGDDSSSGANQIALVMAAGVAALIGVKNGHQWESIEQAVIEGVSVSAIAILILLAVGALIGALLLSGTVQTLIYYGLQVINPHFFYVTACVVAALTAVCIGSSWTVAGTLGIAFIGMAQAMQLSLPVTAGAVVSGAYFGDKLSPLSDTTNLASAVAGVDIFEHIRYMLWTTVPSFLISLVIFYFIGGASQIADSQMIAQVEKGLLENYTIAWYLLLPLALVFLLAIRRVAALPTILLGAIIGGVFAVLFQPESVARLSAGYNVHGFFRPLVAVWIALFDGYKASTGVEMLNDLLSRGGMSSMLQTVWLIICAMAFGAVMEKAGLLHALLHGIATRIESVSALIVTTLFTCVSANVVTADQYIAIVLPGRMFRLEYQKHGLSGKMLSRTLEDSATITSPLVPWNTCGAYMAATLGVATLAYLPFAFFNWIGPIISAIYAITRFRLSYLDQDAVEGEPHC